MMRQDVAVDPDLGLKTSGPCALGAYRTIRAFLAICRASAVYCGTPTSAKRS
jgi:hypothetical protein